MAAELQQASIQLRVGEYMLGRVLLAVFLFLAAVLFARFHPIGLVAGLAVGVAGYALPAVYVKFSRSRRIAKIEKQLIELLPMLASSLRAGFAFQQGVELASQQLGPPLADELALLLNDVNLGATMDEALQDLGRRVGSTDLDMVITAIMVQRTTGGNLSEILDQAAETLRERDRIRGDLQTLTAQQRLTGTILSAYPIAIGLFLLAIMPAVWSTLFTETLGRVLLGTALSLQLVGFFAMRRVMNIEI
jgi:tight adherence protein B